MSEAQRESKWFIERVEENLQDHKRQVRRVTTEAISLHLNMGSHDLRKQVDEKLLSLRMPEDVAALHALADRLDDPTPIPLTIRI